MRGRMGTLLIVLGAALVMAALSLFLWNQRQNNIAGDFTDDVMEKIYSLMDGSDENGSGNEPDAEAADPDFLEEDEPVAVEIDGYEYIGYISIPSLGLELPVMSDWDYEKLQICPCRYAGSVITDDMVICAHNYERHFGTIKNLTPADGNNAGDKVVFTAMDGRMWIYEVIYIGTYQPTDVEKMTSGEYDLTLFTCTVGGKTRVTVGCELVGRGKVQKSLDAAEREGELQ